ncbi:hypothetical protein B0T13DRAFT_485647 [Neurospora crassa]|nr:hypothetical protein B0T13DRAFT_409047 [Neurospora crassa]KAK3504788.1 hypothetical protein B0T13DRAFT_485647 [Neurospora crassa]
MARFAQYREASTLVQLYQPLKSLRECTTPQEDTVRLHTVQDLDVLRYGQPIMVNHQRPKHQKGIYQKSPPPPPPPPPARSSSSSIPPNGAFSNGLAGLNWFSRVLSPALLWCLC